MEREIKRVRPEASSTSGTARGEERMKRPKVSSSSAEPHHCGVRLQLGSSPPSRPTATDEEVEEFFAIVRRMHAASRIMSNGGGGGGGSGRKNRRARSPGEEDCGTDAKGRGGGAVAEWRPTFRWEDFGGEGAKGGDNGRSPAAKGETPSGGGKEKRERAVVVVAGSGAGGGGFRLDLNAEPEPEGVTVGR